MHFKEASAITSLKKRVEIQALLNQGNTQIPYNVDKARQRANELYALKFGVVDAAHLAYAEQIADVFITCDDRLLKKYKKISSSLVAMNPIEFIILEDLQ